MRVLGLDLGDRRVGVAVWDDPSLSPRVLGTVQVTPSTLVQELVAFIQKDKPTHVVIGLPLRLDGREGQASRHARKVAADLAALTNVTVSLQDERLTTAQVYTTGRQAGRNTKQMRASVDAEAAVVLLSTWVAQQQNQNTRSTEDDG